jgi:hypothetical protein
MGLYVRLTGPSTILRLTPRREERMCIEVQARAALLSSLPLPGIEARLEAGSWPFGAIYRIPLRIALDGETRFPVTLTSSIDVTAGVSFMTPWPR